MKKVISLIVVVMLMAVATIGSLAVQGETVDQIVLGFETAAERADIASAQYTYLNPTYTDSTDVKATGSHAVRVTFGEPTDNINQIEIKFPTPQNLAGVQYISFYMKNEGSLPLGFLFSVKSFYVLSSNVDQTLPEDAQEFWGQHLGAYYLQPHDVADAALVRAKSASTWSAASTAAVGDANGAATPFFTIPAGFDGFVKIPLSDVERSVTTPAMCLQIAVGNKGTGSPQFAEYSGKSFVIDDIAIGVTGSASSGTTSDTVQTGDSNVSLFIVLAMVSVILLAAVAVRSRRVNA